MPLEIRPTTAEDLPALGLFLSRGFGLPEDAEAVAPDVLAWKYLEPLPRGLGCGSVVALDESGGLAGHLGFTRTFWRQAGCADRVSTLHMMDWLGSPEHKGAGALLMRRANSEVSTQYGLGGSLAARTVADRTGYRARPPVPVFRRVLRPTWRLRESVPGPALRGVLAARDAIGLAVGRASKGDPAVSVQKVEVFGPEVDDLLDRVEPPLLFSDRGSERLNGVLNYPRGGPEGHRIERAGRVVGFSVTNVIARGRVKVGKLAEVFLVNRDVESWVAAYSELTLDLKRRGADVAVATGSTPWEAEALVRAGFRRVYDLDFVIRDRKGVVPESIPAHVTFLEADYATLA